MWLSVGYFNEEGKKNKSPVHALQRVPGSCLCVKFSILSKVFLFIDKAGSL